LMCPACEIYFASDEVEATRRHACPHCGGRTVSARTVPPAELEGVTLALSDALEYAAIGKPALGYALLIRGMTRAEKILTDGRPWGGELLRCWRAAIDRYCERVGDHEDDDEDALHREEWAAQ
jgi:hypothetical protein